MERPFCNALFQCHSWLSFILLLQLFSLPFTDKVICEQAYRKWGEDLLLGGCRRRTKGINAPKVEHAWKTWGWGGGGQHRKQSEQHVWGPWGRKAFGTDIPRLAPLAQLGEWRKTVAERSSSRNRQVQRTLRPFVVYVMDFLFYSTWNGNW